MIKAKSGYQLLYSINFFLTTNYSTETVGSIYSNAVLMGVWMSGEAARFSSGLFRVQACESSRRKTQQLCVVNEDPTAPSPVHPNRKWPVVNKRHVRGNEACCMIPVPQAL